MAEWRYPGSWSLPHSYYPLVSQVFVGKGCRNNRNPGRNPGLNSGQVVHPVRLPRLLSCYWNFPKMRLILWNFGLNFFLFCLLFFIFYFYILFGYTDVMMLISAALPTGDR